MAHQDPQDRWRRLLSRARGRRGYLLVATAGLLLSVGISLAVLRMPVSAAQQQHNARIVDNPAGLGVTGALSADSPREATDAVANSITAAPFAVPPAPPVATPRLLSDGISPPAIPQLVPHQAHQAAAATSPVNVAPQPSLSPAPWQPGITVASHPPAGPLGIPGVMLGAYQRAAQTLAASQPGCHLSWSVLAGIGRIESGHASGGRVDAAGNTLGRILGARLDGSPGIAAIPDTDHGVFDGDTVWDRAVGPMQFIPSSWRRWGVGSPNNIYDSTLAAGRYLCAGGTNLSDPTQLQAAIYRYNHSADYVAVVMQWANAYLTGVISQPSVPGPVPPGINGNGGRPIVIDPVPPAGNTLTTTTPASPRAATPSPTTSPSPTPAVPTPAATTSPPASVEPVFTPSPAAAGIQGR